MLRHVRTYHIKHCLQMYIALDMRQLFHLCISFIYHVFSHPSVLMRTDSYRPTTSNTGN